MKDFFVKIHDFLIRHRLVSFVVLAILIATQILVGLRIGYKENIADFLPQDDKNARYMSVYESLGDQGTITVVFESKTQDPEEGHFAILEAVDVFEALCDSIATAQEEIIGLHCHVDESKAMDAMAYIREHTALFLTAADYSRIDSLLSIDGYVDSCLSGVHRLMAFPMGQMAMTAVASDPLNLFSPSLKRLEKLGLSEKIVIDEDVVFDSVGRGFAFVDSPYGGSDTKGNARIVNILNDATKATLQQVDSVSVLCVGAPVIAVGNASQIKNDSLKAMAISVVLIAVILFIALRRKRNILLLAFSVAVGWLFAIAAVSLLSTTVSIIVIGIGSVLVGIAVNYPLHFLEHFESHPDRRETLKEMVEPLVTGNITTVSAFACLVFMDSDAMRDLGLFGALMLVGTILFVMIFLPLMVKTPKERAKRDSVDESVHSGESCSGDKSSRAQGFKGLRVQGFKGLRVQGFKIQNSKFNSWITVSLLGVVVGLTVWLGIRSMNPSFDSDLHNINYMTSEQQYGLSILNGMLEDTTQKMEYVVSTGASLDDALHAQEELWDSGAVDGISMTTKGVSGLIPSMQRQQQSLKGWKEMLGKYPTLADDLRRKAGKYGFSESAFEPFVKILESDYEVVEPSDMTPLTDMATNYLLPSDDSGVMRQVSLVYVPSDSALLYKSVLRDLTDKVGSMFVFDIDDVGNNLVNSLNLDFNYILFVCGFVVFIFLCISFGSIELALLSFLPLAVAWLWILGIMDIASVKFNIVNIILATFIFGQGDDYTIFITEGLIYENAYGRSRLNSYRRSVVISSLLMFVGIGSLIFAKHPAMRSLAEVAIIGMIVVVIMACYLPPLLFRWLTEHKGIKRDVPLTLSRLARTFWVLFVFVSFVFLIFSPFTFFYRLVGRDSERKRFKFHFAIHFFIAFAVRHIPGVKFRYDNSVGESFAKPAVIIANHQSHLDLLCLLQISPKMVFLTNDWVWRNPVYGAIIRYAEFYPVSAGYDALLPKLQSLVSRGYSIVVFPEGTRSVDGNIGRFHKGAFLLAQQLGVDLLPVVIHGASHVMPKNDLVLRKGQLSVEVKERVEVSSFMCKDTRLLANEMRALMKLFLDDSRKRLEDEKYWLPFVRSQYIYKGREVAARARRNLKLYLLGGTVHTGQGEVALLKALSNPDNVAHCHFDNEDDFLVAKAIVDRLGVKNIVLTI